MRILTVPADTAILRTKSLPVKKLDQELIGFMHQLGETLKHQHDPDGVGLSAIQVGQAVRVFATLLPESTNDKPSLLFYLNPEIISHSPDTTLGEDLVKRSDRRQATGDKSRNSGQKPEARSREPFLEGCLSIPDIYGPVARWLWIRYHATVISGEQLTSANLPRFALRASRFALRTLSARVFQHELDHLNGVLFTDHVVTQEGQLYEYKNENLVPIEL